MISLLIGSHSLMSKYIMFDVKVAFGRANKVPYAFKFSITFYITTMLLHFN